MNARQRSFGQTFCHSVSTFTKKQPPYKPIFRRRYSRGGLGRCKVSLAQLRLARTCRNLMTKLGDDHGCAVRPLVRRGLVGVGCVLLAACDAPGDVAPLAKGAESTPSADADHGIATGQGEMRSAQERSAPKEKGRVMTESDDAEVPVPGAPALNPAIIASPGPVAPSRPEREILPAPSQPPAEVDPVQPYPGDEAPR
jgi:hypothetical protein